MVAPVPTRRLAACARSRAHGRGRRAWLAGLTATALLASAAPVGAQVLPWEMTVAAIETARVRALAERLSKQNLLFQLRIGDVTKADLVETATDIDRIIESLEEGRSRHSIPAPWTPALREQIAQVDRVWGPIRAIATANPQQHLRIGRQFASAQDLRKDPLLVRHFDRLSLNLVAESEKLLGLYYEECRQSGLSICDNARQVGYSEMLLERAAKQAVYINAGILVNQNRKRLAATIRTYEELVLDPSDIPLLTAALDPSRGASARALGQLVTGLNGDWQLLAQQLRTVGVGAEPGADLGELLSVQQQLVGKIERLTGALMRFANLTYGA